MTQTEPDFNFADLDEQTAWHHHGIPAKELEEFLEEFNQNIVDRIEVVAEFYPNNT